ncbi:MAG: 3-hydroxyacyl-CoA dehydrogenase NAD-binding domain-containing protein, partial [Actinomycetota bacterium]
MQPQDVRRVGVVGCGLMGSGIAEVAARVGIDVVVLEPTEELLAVGRGRIEASTARAVERGRLSEADRDAVLGRIQGVTDFGAFADVDVAIEAATEEEQGKLAIFRSL